jgi:hypothetical protein
MPQVTRGTWWWGGPARPTSCVPSTMACRCGGGGPRRRGAAACRTPSTPGAMNSGTDFVVLVLPTSPQPDCAGGSAVAPRAVADRPAIPCHLMSLLCAPASRFHACFKTSCCLALRVWTVAGGALRRALSSCGKRAGPGMPRCSTWTRPTSLWPARATSGPPHLRS